MRCMISVQLALLLILSAGCSPKLPPAKDNNEPDGGKSVPSDTIVSDTGVSVAGDTLLLPNTEPRLVASLKHTSCYGRCPVYEVQFYSNGQAVYKGESNVPRQGIYLATVSNTTILEILGKAREIRFFELSDFYPENGEPVADLPQSITYLNDGNQEKTIVNNYLAPVKLIAFERFLEKLALEAEWQPKVE